MSFAPAVNYASGGFVQGLAVADVNGDGKLDVVAVNSSEVSSASNNGVVGMLLGNDNRTRLSIYEVVGLVKRKI